MFSTKNFMLLAFAVVSFLFAKGNTQLNDDSVLNNAPLGIPVWGWLLAAGAVIAISLPHLNNDGDKATLVLSICAGVAFMLYTSSESETDNDVTTNPILSTSSPLIWMALAAVVFIFVGPTLAVSSGLEASTTTKKNSIKW